MREAEQIAVIEQLEKRDLISVEQLAAVDTEARNSRRDLLSLMVEKRLVGSEELAEISAGVLGLPFVSLLEKEVPREVLNIVSAELASNYQAVPFARDGQEVSIAMVDPRDYKAVEALDFLARQQGFSIKYFLASSESVGAVLHQYANLSKEVAKALETTDTDIVDVVEETEAEEEKVEGAPVSKMVAVILRYAVEGHASDVHIEPGLHDSRVRYRVDGVLHTSLRIPKNIHNAMVARIKVMANLKLDETRLPQDGRFRRQIDGTWIDFRVSTMPLLEREKVVMRILDKTFGIHSLSQLGFASHNLDVMQKHLTQPHGMLLMTGPTGSGKTTTLYSLLHALNQEDRNIVTLEDPVEYNISGVSQTQVKPEIGLTFARGLRFVLRQDPDIIMVGEIRDNDTAELAIHAALTGHMVLTTLHTNDAFGAIPRLVDMKVDPFLIASAVRLIVAQRLVRRICPDCRQEIVATAQVAEKIINELRGLPAQVLPSNFAQQQLTSASLKIFKGAGCKKCNQEGYHGRLAIAEVVEVTPRMEQIITAGDYQNSAIIGTELQKQGMITMRQDGLIKVLQGQTSIAEIYAVTEE